jgi:hypothetical protein
MEIHLFYPHEDLPGLSCQGQDTGRMCDEAQGWSRMGPNLLLTDNMFYIC